MTKTIVVPVDGSDHAEKAINLASDLATKYDGRIVMLHVLLHTKEPEELLKLVDSHDLDKETVEEIERAIAEGRKESDSASVYMDNPNYVERHMSDHTLQAIGDQIVHVAERLAKEKGVSDVTFEIVDGDPAKCILDCAARSGADYIVMGSRGLGEIEEITIGSVSHEVSRHAKCDCVMIK